MHRPLPYTPPPIHYSRTSFHSMLHKLWVEKRLSLSNKIIFLLHWDAFTNASDLGLYTPMCNLCIVLWSVAPNLYKFLVFLIPATFPASGIRTDVTVLKAPGPKLCVCFFKFLQH
jgi:hypothetical protein